MRPLHVPVVSEYVLLVSNKCAPLSPELCGAVDWATQS